MPQMAPISWLILFSVFTLTLIMFCVMNYYSFLTLPSNSKKSNLLSSSTMNWKW